jgi:hypothetical protein
MNEVFRLQVSQDVSGLAESLGLLEKQVRAAMRTATRKTSSWANREGARGLAKAAGVPLRTLKAGMRIKLKVKSSGGRVGAQLWYGLNPIALKYLGAKQTARGVRGGGQTIPGAFISPELNNHVYRRAGKERLPIIREEMPIYSKAKDFFPSFERRVAEQLTTLFFAGLDKAAGREEGISQALVGSTNA